MKRDLRVSIVGLGKLGASMAAAIADRGFDVVGFDVRDCAVQSLNNGIAPVQEPRLQELIDRNRERLAGTTDVHAAVQATDLTFVVVPTPSEPSGAFSLEYAEQAFNAIGAALAHKQRYHLVVLTSTVLPGATRFRLLAALEQASGKRCGPDFGLCYSPEFIALGSVIHDFLNPDFTLIGEFDERSGTILEQAYRAILSNDAPCRRMSIENAELTKIALNTYVTTKITFANMLADLCERIPGGDVDVVSGALGLDRRIGARYLTGAVSYGGPCFPRDNIALSQLARMLGTHALLADATHALNSALIDRLAERVTAVARPGATVAVLGLAYKPNTPVTEESPGLRLAERLRAAGNPVVGYDPLVNAHQNGAIPCELADTLEHAVRRADVVVVTQPDPALQAARPWLVDRAEPVVLFDCWRAFADLHDHPAVLYHAIGRSQDDVANGSRLSELWQSPLITA